MKNHYRSSSHLENPLVKYFCTLSKIFTILIALSIFLKFFHAFLKPPDYIENEKFFLVFPFFYLKERLFVIGLCRCFWALSTFQVKDCTYTSLHIIVNKTDFQYRLEWISFFIINFFRFLLFCFSLYRFYFSLFNALWKIYFRFKFLNSHFRQLLGF